MGYGDTDLVYYCLSIAFRETVSERPLMPHVHCILINYRLSKRALDTIVLENNCAALRLGIPEELLAKDYESFLVLFNSQLDALSTGNSLTRSIVKEVEHAAINSKMNWTTKIWIRLSLMVGYDLLPARVREAYDLQILRSRLSRFILKAVMASLWLVYPILMWLPLRGVICLMLVLEPHLRPIFKVRGR